jgi:uncharacterized protein YxjI
MKLLIKQRVFSWTDTFDIYDINGNKRYYVKTDFFRIGHCMRVYGMNGQELGVIKQRVFTLLPAFDIEMGGRTVGCIQKRFSLFTPCYDVDYKGYQVKGDFLGWDYDVYSGGRKVIHISKELFHWGDTYVLDFMDPQDEATGLLLVLAIDAANCSNKND